MELLEQLLGETLRLGHFRQVTQERMALGTRANSGHLLLPFHQLAVLVCVCLFGKISVARVWMWINEDIHLQIK